LLRKEKRFLKKPLAILFCVGALVLASVMIPTSSMAREYEQARISEADLRSFQRYLDEHEETAHELYRDPDLINDRKYVRSHQALRDWLEDHPEAAREIRDNPRAVLSRERGRGSRGSDVEAESSRLTERQRRSWDDFLADNRAIARDLSRNPDLVNDTRYVHDHESLDEWFHEHREAATIIMASPSAYLTRSSRSSEPDPEYGQPTASDIQSFEQYLDRNWEVADALYREPDLVKSRGFLRDNPSLDEWMQAHPAAARSIRERPQDYLWRQRSMGIDGFLRGLLTPR
jgi:hypothetical protein